jgi:hypothetical protein
METGGQAEEQPAHLPGRGGLARRLRTSRLGGLVARAADNLRDPGRVTLLLLLAALVLRALWLNEPARGLIFDESFYVNAARVIVGLPAAVHYAGSPVGLDPNTEHPPLGKLLMAASMSVFGDTGLGWRLPSLIAAMVALITVSKIVRTTPSCMAGSERWTCSSWRRCSWAPGLPCGGGGCWRASPWPSPCW